MGAATGLSRAFEDFRACCQFWLLKGVSKSVQVRLRGAYRCSSGSDSDKSEIASSVVCVSAWGFPFVPRPQKTKAKVR